MNIREIAGIEQSYFLINREERNLAAIFYHTLLLSNNLNKFIDRIDCKFPFVETEMGIYFEYAYIRDLWSNINQGNDFKRKLILDLLQPNNREELESKTIFEFNSYFGAVPKPSKTNIQSPSNWSIGYFNDNIKDNGEFLKTCRFKWCFNGKPDIVIHTSKNTAVCIEAKFISKEGQYPSNSDEKNIFKKRQIPMVGQLSIQKQIMNILGINTQFIFLVKDKSVSSNTNSEIFDLTWKEAFSNLDTTNCPYFIKEWIKRPDIS